MLPADATMVYDGSRLWTLSYDNPNLQRDIRQEVSSPYTRATKSTSVALVSLARKRVRDVQGKRDGAGFV